MDKKCFFNFGRGFSNLSVDQLLARECSVVVKDSSTNTMIIRDSTDDSSMKIYAESDVTFGYEIYFEHDISTGGLLLNFLKFIYNYIFAGNPTSSDIIRNDGLALIKYLWCCKYCRPM